MKTISVASTIFQLWAKKSVISSCEYEHDNCGNETRAAEADGSYTTYADDAVYALTREGSVP